MALALLLLDHFHRDTISLFSSKSPTQSCWLFLVFGEEIWIIGSGLILRCFGQKFVGKIFVCLKRQILWWSSLVPHPPECVSFTKGSCITSSFEGSSFYESLHFEKPWIQNMPAICLFSSCGYPFCFLQSSLLNPYLPNHSSAGSQMASMISDILSNTGW